MTRTVVEEPPATGHGRRARRWLAALLAVGLLAPAASCGLFGERPQRFDYGPAPSQFSELWRPHGRGPWPVVVMVHGGSWSVSTDHSVMDDIASDLAHRGVAVWNIEYRRLGEDGGGWPGTFEDVAAAIDDLASRADELGVDTGRVVFLGHSAGGQLALWAAARGQVPAGDVGAAPTLLPDAVVGLAPVTDLEGCARDGALEGTCASVMGGSPDDEPDRYARFSPVDLVPLGVPQRLFHGTADTVIPVSDCKTYVEAATAAGDDATLTEQPDANHFTVLEPDSPAWAQARDTVEQLLG